MPDGSRPMLTSEPVVTTVLKIAHRGNDDADDANDAYDAYIFVTIG